MARIVYGVSGEGSGHSSRAREMLEFLQGEGHEVKVLSYDRGYRNLSQDFDVREVVGLTIVSEDNQVSTVRTLLENLKRIPEGIDSFQQTRRELFKKFKPDCVISDFEPTSAYLAEYYDLPLISLDNQHRMRYMKYPCPEAFKKDALLTEGVIRTMVPWPTVSLITTFYFGELTNKRSFLFPPILRQNVLQLSPKPSDHVLVYATSGFDSLLNILKEFNRERFIVYGYDRDAIDGNLQYKPFSKDGFLQDLTTAKAVVATAGFTLMTESLHLGIPYMALPMQGQFEQILNAEMLEELGYGAAMMDPAAGPLARFFYHLPDYKEKLKQYPRQGNDKIKEFLGQLLHQQCSLLKHYYNNRDEYN